MKKQSTMIVSIILLIVFVIFALLNTATVEVNLLFSRVKTPLVLLILVCLLIGALIIYLFSFSNHIKVNKEIKELQKQPNKQEITRLKREIKQLQDENRQLKHSLTTRQQEVVGSATQPTQPTNN
ncbi:MULTISPECIES: lipopolysaccharide assembly LapA domain-containing protein [Limosilactobacillus]|uniref:Lipopolysaccharide assembly protein LapA domain-containing protein n=1 Tax=Limosilactobacillus pontis TaxID=35787 RepID=A0ABU7SQR9_9LACO|nr:lipopolysaccharide assembly protein LapA domain-containing protein [Limosilactobacillus pontis]MCX2185958.1 lipopolysaccharide assembly protein LapA domain-containing protein [Limosilactobacillus pontis]MCX2187699.1 lipopolysaccharide assembly protein LapA domain-containing protein [Limosilactobacillus pontis]